MIKHFFRNYVQFSGRATRKELLIFLTIWYGVFVTTLGAAAQYVQALIEVALTFVLELALFPIFMIIAIFMGKATPFGILAPEAYETLNQPEAKIFLYLFLGFILLTAIPRLALYSRRLHDTNRSAHWIWLILAAPIPIVGIFTLMGFLFIALQKGTEGDNKYGPDPLA